MAAQLWCTGPAHISVSFGAGNAGVGSSTYYLGTAERAPKITIMPEWLPVMNDLGGHVIPFDESYQGKHASISTMLTRWDESVVQSVYAMADGSGGGGADTATGDIGALMNTENFAMTVWIQFPYQSVSSYSTMPAGYRFYTCTLDSPVDFDTIGTEGRKLLLNFHAIRSYNSSTRTLTLYDTPSSGYATPT